jgi:hypothetical protein
MPGSVVPVMVHSLGVALCSEVSTCGGGRGAAAGYSSRREGVRVGIAVGDWQLGLGMAATWCATTGGWQCASSPSSRCVLVA